jgi:hypothetical protein
MTNLLALADRVERATDPDGELEADIWFAVTEGATRNKWSYVHKATGRECWMDETRDKFGHLVLVPRYMESLDAAMTLVPKGCSWTLEPDGAWIRWMGKDDVEEVQCVLQQRGGTCTPIALTTACLRARASTDKGEA